jgi:hypothetical protein
MGSTTARTFCDMTRPQFAAVPKGDQLPTVNWWTKTVFIVIVSPWTRVGNVYNGLLDTSVIGAEVATSRSGPRTERSSGCSAESAPA